jgi:hypothetical protein
LRREFESDLKMIAKKLREIMKAGGRMNRG